ncbi:ABC transporter substrate-binding protein [Cohnella sp. JJ-181]|uniref:ABC transporter substrate-binding protein n=1 Tax=Cohnella rhizoplanae TaxID=2974897 RepID=UPI0022FFB207|nr:extracellular solute-binding protein [Cohnella sp. JJ-181]CAI6039795.1 hypothetical protein COHCIP112018_01038 [Cohnella sp. JJ-181]
MNSAIRKSGAIAAASALMLALAACGSNNNEGASASSEATASATASALASATASSEPTAKPDPVTVSYIAAASQLNYGGIKDLIAKWEAQTGNKVDIQAIQDDQYDNLVKAKLSGGGDIDIFFGAYAKYDVPNQLLEISGEPFESRLNDIALASMKYADGKIYGFPSPMALSSWGAFYNKKVFADLGLTPPKTLDELNQTLEKIKTADKTPIYFAAKDGWTMLQHRNGVNGVIGGEDPTIWDKLNNNQIGWKDIPGFLEQYKQVEEWSKKGYLNKDLLTATYEKQQQMLVKGDAAIIFQGAFVVPELLKIDPAAEIGFFPLPNTDGSQTIALTGATQVYIAKNSKHAEASKDLLRFLSDQAQVQSYLEISPGVSAFKDVDVSDKMPESLKEIQNIVNSGKLSRHGDEAYIVPLPYDDMVAAYSELLAGKITAEEFVKKNDDMFRKNAKIAKIPGF